MRRGELASIAWKYVLRRPWLVRGSVIWLSTLSTMVLTILDMYGNPTPKLNV